jgi:putative ABC transport system permease protein
MAGLSQDIQYAARTLVKHRGFAIASALTLALGIAAATIVYSLVDGILLRPLPIRDPDRVVFARELSPEGLDMSLSWPNFVDWQARAQSFESMAAWRGTPANLTGTGTAKRIYIRHVTWNLFDVLGVRPILGRGLTEADDRYGVERVGLVSYGFWQRDLGGRTDAIGTRVMLNDEPVTIVGVLPADFTVARQEDVFLPFLNLYAPDSFMFGRGNHNGLGAIARLKPGVTLDEARAELGLIASQLRTEHPDTNSGQGAVALPLLEVLVRDARPMLIVLLGAVAAMLLIACVNIANLLIVRGAARAQELEVRRALGADRWRIVRQLLVESLLLGGAGGIVGVALAYAGFEAFLALLPPDQPRIHQVAIDARVLAVAALVSVAAGLLFGMVPALQAGSSRAVALLRGGRVSGGGAPRTTTRRLLLIAELSLALVLLVAAGLMVRTIANLSAIETGFAAEHVLSAQIMLPVARYNPEQRRAFYARAEERLRAVPGVENAAFTISVPALGSSWNSVFIVDGQPVPPRSELPSAAWTPVSVSYFDTVGIRVLRGRAFTAADGAGAPTVAVVNETFARRFWPGRDPIGQRIKQGWPEDKTAWREVVGVVNDVKTDAVDQPVRLQAYLPLAQEPFAFSALVVRTAGDPAVLRATVEAAIREIDPNLPVYDVRTLEQVIQNGVGRQRLLMVLLLGFGGIALVMSAVGVFGVTAYSISQRTQEFGVRMALGAGRGRVLGLVLRQSLWPCLVGIALGVAGSLAATRVLRALLFQVEPFDPATLSAVSLILLLVAGIACVWPARRATRVDPVTALRVE